MRIIKYVITIAVQVTDNIYDEYEDTCYRIEDDEGNFIDDAQVYGYESRQKAAKALWHKFKGDREKLNAPVYVHRQAQKLLEKAYKAGSKIVFKDENNEYYWEAS